MVQIGQVSRWSRAVAGAALLFLAANTAFAQEAWKQELAKVTDAARKEGAVVVSGPPGPAQRRVITEQWAKAYPHIKLEYTGVRGTEIVAKVLRERSSGIRAWDIILSHTDPTAFALPAVNALAPLREALIDPALSDDRTWINGFAAGFMDDEKKFLYSPFGQTGQELGYVNRACMPKDVFNKLDDLKKPELKGKIAWFDPSRTGIGSLNSWALVQARGEDWLKDMLLNHSVTYSRDFRQLTDWMVNCSKPVAIGITNDVLKHMQTSGIGTTVEALTGPAYFGNQPPGWVIINAAIAWYRDPPHPNAAKLFVNWYLSRDFQEAYALGTEYNSRRVDTKPGVPGAVLQPGVKYVSWHDQRAFTQFRELQEKIAKWDIVK